MTPSWAFTSGVSSESSSRPTVVRSRWPCSILVNLARLVLSQSCSVLRSVVSRKLPQIADHRVDVVLKFGHLAARIDLDRSRQVAFGHGGGNLGDGTHLGGEVGGQ